MSKEWIKAITIFIKNGTACMAQTINGDEYSKASVIRHYAFFFVISITIALFLGQGFSPEFLDYLKDVFAIFVGFFITSVTFIFDKLDTRSIPTEKEQDILPAEKRLTSTDRIKIKHERNYTKRFFYAIGMNILLAIVVLLLIVPNIIWPHSFNIDIFSYRFTSEVSHTSIVLFIKNLFLFTYRVAVIYGVVKVFFYSIYMITSLLQVLIIKKNLS